MYLFIQLLKVSNNMMVCDVWVQEVVFRSSENVHMVIGVEEAATGVGEGAGGGNRRRGQEVA